MTAAVDREVAALKAAVKRYGARIESAAVSAAERVPVYDDAAVPLHCFRVGVKLNASYFTRPHFPTREEAEAFRAAAVELIASMPAKEARR